MAGARHLHDTNIDVALLNGDPGIVEKVEQLPEVFVTPVVLGELLNGAASSGRPEANVTRVDAFATAVSIVLVDTETARRYGALKGDLRRQGLPIPENDLWIAASSLQHGLVLVTRDRHFEAVPGMQLERW